MTTVPMGQVQLMHNMPCPCCSREGRTVQMWFDGPVLVMNCGKLRTGPDVVRTYWHGGKYPGQRVQRQTIRRWDYVRCPECATTLPYAAFGLTEWPDHRPPKKRPPKQRKRRSR